MRSLCTFIDVTFLYTSRITALWFPVKGLRMKRLAADSDAKQMQNEKDEAFIRKIQISEKLNYTQ